MFALLGTNACSINNSFKVAWKEANVLQATDDHADKVQPSMLDKLAAPTVFMQQALVYPEGLHTDVLKAAVHRIVDKFPVLGARVTQEDGQLQLFTGADSGVMFMHGSVERVTLQQLLAGLPVISRSGVATATGSTSSTGQSSSIPLPQHQQQLLVLPELPDAIFGDLPGALTPDYVDCPDLGLIHIALVHLAGGGSVLGLRMSHLLGDWGSARLLLRSIAVAYGQIAAQQQQQHSNRTHGPEANGLQAANSAGACSGSCHTTGVAGRSTFSVSSQGSELPAMILAAPLLNSCVLKCRQHLHDGYTPVRLKPMQQADEELFSKLGQLSHSSSGSSGIGCEGKGDDDSKSSSTGKAGDGSSSGQPQRLTYHLLPGRILELKQEAKASAAAAVNDHCSISNSTSFGEPVRALTSHNVLLARMAKAFCSVPGRRGTMHDIAISVDMRRKLPPSYLEYLAQQQHQHQHQVQHCEGCAQHVQLQQDVQKQLEAAVGNFFGTAIVEDCTPEQLTLGQLAEQVYSAIHRSCDIWLPDLAWASSTLSITAAELAPKHSNHHHHHHHQQQQQQEEVASKHQVTWRRLHAMGPRNLLQQQLDLGLLASLSSTQWPLHYADDACMAGQLPILAVPGFSQPQPYPLVIFQHAPAAMGGGMLVHVWLDGCEVEHLQHVVAALGGL